MGIDFNDSLIQLFSSIFLIAFFALSVLVVRNDIATHKIPNKLLICFLIIGLLAYAVMLCLALYTHNEHAIMYIKCAALNVLISIVVGYAFWHFDLWSPGDGKYFPIVAMLVPLKSYTFQWVPYFPSVTILINTYIIAFLALAAYSFGISILKLVRIIFKGRNASAVFRSSLTAALGKATNGKFIQNTLAMLLYFMSIFLVIRGLQDSMMKHIHIPAAGITLGTFIVMYYFGGKIQVMLQKSAMTLIIAYIVFACVMTFHLLVLHQNLAVRILNAFLGSFFFMVFMPLARAAINAYQETAENITVEKLQPGMSLREETAKYLAEERGLANITPGQSLTVEQVDSIRGKCPPETEILRIAHYTFGPFIFLGTLFTLKFSCSIIHYLR